MKKLFILFFGAWISFSVLAENVTPATQPTNQNLYQIDLIVFSQINNAALESENWPSKLQIPYAKNPTELMPVLPNTPIQPYQTLPDNQQGLQKELDKLSNDSDYKILLHVSWQQSIGNIKQAPWIHIDGGQAYDQNGQPMDMPSAPTGNPTVTPKFWELNGFLRISQDTFYNINARLYLTTPTSLLGGSTSEPIGNFQPIPLMTFTLFENRRTKLNELNYLDHPLFGALIKITKVKTDDTNNLSNTTPN